MSRSLASLLAAAALALLAVAPVSATEVKSFRLQSQKAFLAGNLEGISLDPDGRLELADRAERVTALAEPFLFAAAVHPQGWVVGTGNDGKVFLVRRDGTVEELFAAPEGQIFAVWADADGTVFAGASPGGKVYRIPGGGAAAPPATAGTTPAPWFASGETYVWDIRRGPAGDLLVATGTTGKLFRVAADGTGSVVYDTDDTHVRSVAVTAGGEVLLGTAGEGLILRIAADGSARTLFDAEQPEVVAFAVPAAGEAPGIAFYAAVIASEASAVELPTASSASASGDRSAGAASAGGGPGERAAPSEVVVQAGVAPPAGSRPSGFKGKRSQILAVSPDGVVESVWAFDDDTIFDIAWIAGRLWVATGLEGKLYSFDGEQMVLEKAVDERQIVALLAPEPAFATTNAPAVYRLSGDKERRGTYTSAALDAGAVARFGTLRWRGDLPEGGGLSFAFRSGISAEPDRTWSDWTAPRRPSASGEVEVAGLPNGRYVQWRATLEAPGRPAASRERGVSPRIDAVELSYRQQNLRPRLESFEVLDPGQILVEAGFNPSNQVYEPAHPNRDGIFTTLEPEANGASGRTKTLWKKGFRSFRWSAEDPNNDALRYALAFRPEGAASTAWLPVAEELDEAYYSFDATVLPDGVYRFRVRASDAADNAPGEAETGEALSEPVVIDHSPPVVVEAKRTSPTLRVVLADALNPLRAIEVSVDAGEWQQAAAADGLLDARRETVEIPVPDGARLLLLRVTDAAYNVMTFDLSDRL